MAEVPSEEELRRLADIALEYGVAIRLPVDGAIEIVGPLLRSTPKVDGASSSAVERSCAEIGSSEAPNEGMKRGAAKPKTVRGLRRALREGELLTYQQTAFEIGISRWTL